MPMNKQLRTRVYDAVDDTPRSIVELSDITKIGDRFVSVALRELKGAGLVKSKPFLGWVRASHADAR